MNEYYDIYAWSYNWYGLHKREYFKPTGRWMLKSVNGYQVLYIESYRRIPFFKIWVDEYYISIDKIKEFIGECR